MDCPGCQQPMEPVPLEGTYRGPMTIDVCTACRGFWFDAGEQFRLTPAATLLLVRRVEASRDKPRQRMGTRPRCPRCNPGARPHLRPGPRRQVPVLPLPVTARRVHAVLRVPAQPESGARSDAAGGRRAEAAGGLDHLLQLRRADRSADRRRRARAAAAAWRSSISTISATRCASSTRTRASRPQPSARRRRFRRTRSSPTGAPIRKRAGGWRRATTTTRSRPRSICSTSA